jgi:hypothetical protein
MFSSWYLTDSIFFQDLRVAEAIFELEFEYRTGKDAIAIQWLKPSIVAKLSFKVANITDLKMLQNLLTSTAYKIQIQI